MIIAAFIGIQIASMVVTLLFVQQYRYFVHKHECLLHAIDDRQYPASSFQSFVTMWIYIILTITIIAITSALFLFGPPTS